jgi:hypothetical protein
MGGLLPSLRAGSMGTVVAQGVSMRGFSGILSAVACCAVLSGGLLGCEADQGLVLGGGEDVTAPPGD